MIIVIIFIIIWIIRAKHTNCRNNQLKKFGDEKFGPNGWKTINTIAYYFLKMGVASTKLMWSHRVRVNMPEHCRDTASDLVWYHDISLVDALYDTGLV